MKKFMKKLRPYKLLVIFVLLFSIILFTGYFFYQTTRSSSNVVDCFFMSFQNALECALANPILTFAEISRRSEDNVFLGSSAVLSWRYLLILIYGTAVIAFPIVNLFLAFSILDNFLHLKPDFPWEKAHRVMVIGYNDQVRSILNRRVNDKKIYLWTSSPLSREDEWKLYFSRVSVKNQPALIANGPEEEAMVIDRLNEFIQEKHISDILLLDELSALNMQYYLSISRCPVCRKRNIRFSMLCPDWEIRKFAEDVFDARLKQEERLYDLRIFSYEQLLAEKLFRNVPIFSGISLTATHLADIHMVIIGGGSLGEQLLLQTMNLGVLSDNNGILIDVIDKDMASLEKRLDKRFQPDYFEIRKTEKEIQYCINSDKADGRLQIRLHQYDIEEEPLGELLQELSANIPITYAAVCIPGQDINLHCLIALERLKHKQSTDFPLALRMMYTKALEEYISHNSEQSKYPRVWFMGAENELPDINEIINAAEEKKIREYNSIYNAVTGNMGPADIKRPVSSAQADEEWNCLEYYKREVNRALYYHSLVKETMTAAMDPNCSIPDSFWGDGNTEENNISYSERLLEKEEDGSDRYPQLVRWARMEHRRWCYFMASYGWSRINPGEKKNVEKRLHNCMWPWSELTDPGNPTTRSTVIYDLLTHISKLKH